MGSFIRATVSECHNLPCSPYWEQFSQLLTLYGSVVNSWASSLAWHMLQLLTSRKILLGHYQGFYCLWSKLYMWTGEGMDNWSQLPNEKLSEVKHFCVLGSGHSLPSNCPSSTEYPFTSPLEMSHKTAGHRKSHPSVYNFSQGDSSYYPYISTQNLKINPYELWPQCPIYKHF